MDNLTVPGSERSACLNGQLSWWNGDVMTSNQLESLFRTCDKTGSGKIGLDAFRDLCTEFDIQEADCVAIFNDLDHDGDGQVSLDDFAWGFRDFLRSPQARRGSLIDFENLMCKGKAEPVAALELVQRRHSEARTAWAHLVAGVGEPAVRKFLNQRSVWEFQVHVDRYMFLGIERRREFLSSNYTA